MTRMSERDTNAWFADIRIEEILTALSISTLRAAKVSIGQLTSAAAPVSKEGSSLVQLAISLNPLLACTPYITRTVATFLMYRMIGTPAFAIGTQNLSWFNEIDLKLWCSGELEANCVLIARHAAAMNGGRLKINPSGFIKALVLLVSTVTTFMTVLQPHASAGMVSLLGFAFLNYVGLVDCLATSLFVLVPGEKRRSVSIDIQAMAKSSERIFSIVYAIITAIAAGLAAIGCALSKNFSGKLALAGWVAMLLIEHAPVMPIILGKTTLERVWAIKLCSGILMSAYAIASCIEINGEMLVQ